MHSVELWIVAIMALLALAMILFHHILELVLKLVIWGINAGGDVRDAYRDRFAPERRPPCRGECRFPQQRSGSSEGNANGIREEGAKPAGE